MGDVPRILDWMGHPGEHVITDLQLRLLEALIDLEDRLDGTGVERMITATMVQVAAGIDSWYLSRPTAFAALHLDGYVRKTYRRQPHWSSTSEGRLRAIYERESRNG